MIGGIPLSLQCGNNRPAGVGCVASDGGDLCFLSVTKIQVFLFLNASVEAYFSLSSTSVKLKYSQTLVELFGFDAFSRWPP